MATGAFVAGAGARDDCAITGSSRFGAAEDAGDAAAVTGVSTTGEKLGAGDVGICSGRAGVPAAIDSVTAGAKVAGDSPVFAVASMPAISGLAAGFALFLAREAPGIGLGSIAGLDSV